VTNILKASIARGTGDNVTCSVIAFDGLQRRLTDKINKQFEKMEIKRSESLESNRNNKIGCLTERLNRGGGGQNIDSLLRKMK
jgi:hypothetical protein